MRCAFSPIRRSATRAWSQVIRFDAKEQPMIEEAARRMAAGVDPGIIPARFLDRCRARRHRHPPGAARYHGEEILPRAREAMTWQLKRRFNILSKNSAPCARRSQSLRLTAVEDRPLQDEVLLVERLANTVDDLIGWLDEAVRRSGRRRKGPSRHPLDSYRAREALALANDRFIRLEYKFYSEGVSYEEINELSEGSGSGAGAEWLGWTRSVIQALDQCRAPVRALDEALLQGWRELAERLGTSTVSVQTTNIGQQISAPAAASSEAQLDVPGSRHDAMT